MKFGVVFQKLPKTKKKKKITKDQRKENEKICLP